MVLQLQITCVDCSLKSVKDDKRRRFAIPTKFLNLADLQAEISPSNNINQLSRPGFIHIKFSYFVTYTLSKLPSRKYAMADLAMILGAVAFAKQVIPVGIDLYNYVKAYGSNFPPNMSRADALKTVRGLIAKLRQQHELPALKAEGRFTHCPDIRKIPDVPGSASHDAKKQAADALRLVQSLRLKWCDSLETLWEEYEAHFSPLTEVEIDVFNAALQRAEGPQNIEWRKPQMHCSEATAAATVRDDGRSTRRGDRASKAPSTIQKATSKDEGKPRMPCEYPTEASTTYKSPSVTTEPPPSTAYTTRVESNRKAMLASSRASLATACDPSSAATVTRKLTIRNPASKQGTAPTSSKLNPDSSTRSPEKQTSSLEAPSQIGSFTRATSSRDPSTRSRAERIPSVKVGRRVDQLKREDAGSRRELPSRSMAESSSGRKHEPKSSDGRKRSDEGKKR